MRTNRSRGNIGAHIGLRRASLRALTACMAAVALGVCLPQFAIASVTPSGQFTTEIPIEVPPFHGIEPRLRLVYRSGAPNGWLGAGWELEGGPSEIVRASKGRGAPRFDGQDIFLLDGQELVPCTTNSTSPSCTSAVAAFGSSTYFYSTKIETFQRVEYVPANDSWVVWAHNGVKRIFTPDIVALNPKGTWRWPLHSEADTHGNEVDYEYELDRYSRTVSYLSHIAYKTPDGVGVSAIYFMTDSQGNTPVTYGTGYALAELRELLFTIDVVFASKRVRGYRLGYRVGASNGEALLDSVVMYGNDATINCGSLVQDTCDKSRGLGDVTAGTVSPATTFQYDETANAGFTPATVSQGDGPYGNMIIVGDFDGDGKLDFLTVGDAFLTRLSNGDGKFRYAWPGIPSYCVPPGVPKSATNCFNQQPGAASVVIGDFDGDGRTDFLTAVGSSLHTFFSNGDGTFTEKASALPSFCANSFCLSPPVPGDPGDFPCATVNDHGLCPSEVITGDFNGDGKTDFLVAADKFYAVLSGDVRGSDGDVTVSYQVVETLPPLWCGGTAAGCVSNGIIVGDFDGDGNIDFLTVANGNFALFRSNGDGHFTGISTPPPAGCPNANCFSTIIVGDFNGDGKTDFLVPGSGVMFSNGDGSFTLVNSGILPLPPFCTTLPGSGCLSSAPNHLIVGDFNGDGKTDFASANQSIDVWISLGDGNFRQVASTPLPSGCGSAYTCIDRKSPYSLITGDFNGDGKSDFLWAAPQTVSATYQGLQLANGGPVDFLTAAQNGIGSSVSVGYAPSSKFWSTGPAWYLPTGFVFQTATSVTVRDNATGIVDTRSYAYSGALYDDVERSLLGFTNVRETNDAARDYRETAYALTSACVSQPLKSYLRDPTGRIFTYNQTSYVPSGGPPYQCQPASQTIVEAELTCSDDASCAQSGARTIGTDLSYDNYGNLALKIEHGDTKVIGDERTTNWTYNANLSDYIVSLPSGKTIFEGEGISDHNIVTWTSFAYDDQAVGAPPIKGDLTQRVVHGAPSVAPQTTAFGYDSFGNQTSITDANSHTSTITFDSTYGLYPVKLANALGQATNLKWDFGLGKKLSDTDPNGALTTYWYDVLGRPSSMTRADGGATQYTYNFTTDSGKNPTGLETRNSIADGSADGLWTSVYTDGLGRTYRTLRKGNYEQDRQYGDATLRPFKESTWYEAGGTPYWTHYQYDGAGRLTATVHPDGSQKRIAYNVANFTRFDELSNDTTYFTDAYQRTSAIQEHTDSGLPKTLFEYDPVDELTLIQDAAGFQTLATNDNLGHKLQQNDPDTGTWNYTYDGTGNLWTRQDAIGQKITFAYDPLNRLQSKTNPDGSNSQFKYDESGHGASVGRLTSVAQFAPDGSQKGSEAFTYDIMGRVTSSTKCQAVFCYTFQSKFDTLGRLSQLTYPDSSGNISSASEVVTYGYDASGRLSSMSGRSSYIDLITYEPDDQVSSIKYGNGPTSSRIYDPQRRWLNQEQVTTLGPLPFLYAAVYSSRDPAGRIKAISGKGGYKQNLIFDYDRLGRLLHVSGDQSQTFSYDDIGNVTFNSAVGAYAYLGSHRLISAGPNSYFHDANGNITSGAGRTIVWNFDNFPTTVTTSVGISSFDYDASNRRVSKLEPGDTTPTYYFGPLAERTPAGDVVLSYFAGSTLIARRSLTTSSVSFYHLDHLGSVRALTDSQGKPIEHYGYAAFGTTQTATGGPLDSYGYTSHLRNPSTALSGQDSAGLIYMNARYYDATLGRFLSPDSLIPDLKNPQTFNLYSYALNNPVLLSDPSGHRGVPEFREPRPPVINLLKLIELIMSGGEPFGGPLGQVFTGSGGLDDLWVPMSEKLLAGFAGAGSPSERSALQTLKSKAVAMRSAGVLRDLGAAGDPVDVLQSMVERKWITEDQALSAWAGTPLHKSEIVLADNSNINTDIVAMGSSVVAFLGSAGMAELRSVPGFQLTLGKIPWSTVAIGEAPWTSAGLLAASFGAGFTFGWAANHLFVQDLIDKATIGLGAPDWYYNNVLK